MLQSGCDVPSRLEKRVRQHQADRIVVLLSGDRVLSLDVEVEQQHATHYKKIVPYLVEEEIADDLDEVHIAYSPAAGEGSNQLAVVSHNELVDWLDEFYEFGLEPEAMLAEAYCLPDTGTPLRVLVDEEHCLIQYRDYCGVAVGRTELDMVLSLYSEKQNSKEPSMRSKELEFGEEFGQSLVEQSLAEQRDVTLMVSRVEESAVESLDQLEAELKGFPIESRLFSESAFAMLACTAVRAISRDSALNILQGGYRTQRKERYPLPWRKLAMAATLIASVHLGVYIGSGLWFQSESERYRQAVFSEYRGLFPNAKTVVDPRRQFQVKLNARSEGDSSKKFLHLLSAAVDPMPDDAVRLRSLRYSAGKSELVLNVETDSLSDIETLERELQSAPAKAEILSAIEQQDTVSARLRLVMN